MSYHFFKKSNKIIFYFLGLITIGCLFFVSILIYNQKSATAQEEITLCSPEIPIGEAFEKTADTLHETQREFQSVGGLVFTEINAANEMIELAQKCDIKKCSPVCSPEKSEPFNCNPYLCNPYPCNCRTIGTGKAASTVCNTCWNTCYETCYKVGCATEDCSGSPCENGAINEQFNVIENTFNQIKGSSNRIRNQFQNRVEIGEKLTQARENFNNCSQSLTDWEKVMKGEYVPKQPLSCITVFKENLPRKQVECKSLFNFFCCK